MSLFNIPAPNEVAEHDTVYADRLQAAIEKLTMFMKDKEWMVSRLVLVDGKPAYVIPKYIFPRDGHLVDSYLADQILVELIKAGWLSAYHRPVLENLSSIVTNIHTGFEFVLPRKLESIPDDVRVRIRSENPPFVEIKEAPQTPFNQPDLIVKRVGRTEILDLLRGVTIKAHMPSATGKATYNMSPTYVKGGIEQWFDPTGSAADAFSEGSGYYANDNEQPPYPTNTGVWAALHLGAYIVACQLCVDKLWVRFDNEHAPWHLWEEGSIAINRAVLSDVFENHF